MFYSSCIARVRWVGVWVCLCMFEFVIKVKIKSEWEFVNVKFAWRNNIRETEREKRYGVTWHLLLLPFSRGYKNEFILCIRIKNYNSDFYTNKSLFDENISKKCSRYLYGHLDIWYTAVSTLSIFLHEKDLTECFENVPK